MKLNLCFFIEEKVEEKKLDGLSADERSFYMKHFLFEKN
jgi:hypothetical protein